jgi:hypothetical protein
MVQTDTIFNNFAGVRSRTFFVSLLCEFLVSRGRASEATMRRPERSGRVTHLVSPRPHKRILKIVFDIRTTAWYQCKWPTVERFLTLGPCTRPFQGVLIFSFLGSTVSGPMGPWVNGLALAVLSEWRHP